MKKLIILIFVVMIGIAGFYFLNKNSKTSSTPPIISSSPVVDNQDKSPSNSFTAQEVATHNNTKDCWIIINQKVYDMTDYAPSHPKGLELITDMCGKDATQGYQTRNGKGPHTEDADAQLSQLFIGDLK